MEKSIPCLLIHWAAATSSPNTSVSRPEACRRHCNYTQQQLPVARGGCNAHQGQVKHLAPLQSSPLIRSNLFCKNKVQGQTPYFSMWFPLRIICIKQGHLLYNIQNAYVPIRKSYQQICIIIKTFLVRSSFIF